MVHAVFVGRGHMPLRIRAFIDFLVERYASRDPTCGALPP